MSHALLVGCLALAIGGCSPSTDLSSPRPTGVLPTSTPESTGAASLPTPLPTLPPWPVGWDADFCDYFAQLVIITELAVDIEPTIADGPARDALGLAQELATTPAYARGLVDTLDGWLEAESLAEVSPSLLDTAEQAGVFYVRYLEQGRNSALSNARKKVAELGGIIDQANEALGPLAAMGLACPDHALQLERP
jgi:hypothetical protein